MTSEGTEIFTVARKRRWNLIYYNATISQNKGNRHMLCSLPAAQLWNKSA